MSYPPRCSHWLTELAREGGPPIRCRLLSGHKGNHQYGATTQWPTEGRYVPDQTTFQERLWQRLKRLAPTTWAGGSGYCRDRAPEPRYVGLVPAELTETMVEKAYIEASRRGLIEPCGSAEEETETAEIIRDVILAAFVKPTKGD